MYILYRVHYFIGSIKFILQVTSFCSASEVCVPPAHKGPQGYHRHRYPKLFGPIIHKYTLFSPEANQQRICTDPDLFVPALFLLNKPR